MSDVLPTITLDEVSQHNTEDSCWIIISGKVYDVTSFLQEHPGGEEVITQLAGMDSTAEFLDVGHSKDAMEMAKEYLIGQLPEHEVPSEAPVPAPVVVKPAPAAPCSSALKVFLTCPAVTNVLIPTTMGLGIYFIYKCVSRSQKVY